MAMAQKVYLKCRIGEGMNKNCGPPTVTFEPIPHVLTHSQQCEGSKSQAQVISEDIFEGYLQALRKARGCRLSFNSAGVGQTCSLVNLK